MTPQTIRKCIYTMLFIAALFLTANIGSNLKLLHRKVIEYITLELYNRVLSSCIKE